MMFASSLKSLVVSLLAKDLVIYQVARVRGNQKKIDDNKNPGKVFQFFHLKLRLQLFFNKDNNFFQPSLSFLPTG